MLGLQVSNNYCYLSGSFKTITTFSDSDNFKLPILIEGRLITSGFYKDAIIGDFNIRDEDIKKSMNSWVGIKLYKDHSAYKKIRIGEPVPIDMVVGKIVSVSSDKKEPALNFVAEIYDRDVAYKMLKGLITFVSVGFLSDMDSNRNRINIEPKELSLVEIPRDKNAKFNIKKVEY
jgi:hypothetical protein